MTNNKKPMAQLTIVTNFRFAMEIFTNAMTNKTFHHIEIICMCEIFDNCTDFFKFYTWTTYADAVMQTFFGFLN